MSSWAQQQQLLAAARLTLGAGVASASRACSAAASAACASTTAISSARHAASERVPPAAAPQEQAQTTPHPGEQIQPRDGSLRAVTASSSACDHVTGRQSSHHQASTSGITPSGSHGHGALRIPSSRAPPVQQQQRRLLSTGSSSTWAATESATSSSAAVEGAMRAEQAASELSAQLSACTTLEQLDALLDTHLHLMDSRCIRAALDKVVRSIALWRPDPQLRPACAKLGGAYMQLLPTLPHNEALSILHSFAVIRHNPGGDEEGYKALCGHMSEQVLPLLQQQEAYTELGNLLWDLQTLSHHGELEFDAQMLSQSEPTLRLYLKSMPLSVLSKVAEAYGEGGESHHAFLEQVPLALEERLQGRYGRIDAAAVTNILKALALSNAPVPPSLLRKVAEFVVARDEGLRLHHVVSLAKSFAVLRFGDVDDMDRSYETDRFWQAVSGYVEFHRQALTPQMLQDLAYAWALRKQVDNTLYNVVAARSRALMESFKPANLAMLLWGFARQGRVQDSPLYAAACQHILAHLPEFSIKHVANSLWSLACLEHKDPVLLAAVAAHLKQLLQDPDGRSDLTVDAATGRERFRIPGVAPRVERYVRADGAVYQDIQFKSGNRVTRPLHAGVPQRQFITQNLTDIMWALAKLEHDDVDLFALLAQRCLENVDSLTLTSVVDCCWALTHAKLRHPELLRALEAHLVETQLLGHLGLDYLSDVLYALAVLGHRPSEHFLERTLDLAHGKWDRLRQDQDSTLVRIIYSLQELGAIDVHPGHPFIHRIMDYIELANAEQERQEEAQRPQQLALRQGEARAGGGAGGQDLGAGGQHGVQTATA